MKRRNLLLLACSPLLVTSCLVTKKQYHWSERGRVAALFSRDSLADLLAASRSEADGLTHDKNALMKDTASLNKSLRSYKGLLANSNHENERLNSKNKELNTQLGKNQQTILELQNMIKEQNQRVKALLDNVKNALNGFSSDELTVHEEGGKVYVAMSDKLLFESASANVNEQGKEALGKLSEVLNKQTDIDVFIEGHTDSVPIHTPIFKDNWDLSVIRATSVVRILTDDYQVSPLQIQPCGRGEFRPVADNQTPEGRSRNRRTEIIIAPKLDKLYQMLNDAQ